MPRLLSGAACCARSPGSRTSPGAPVPPILPPCDGFLFLNRDKFRAALPATCKPATPGSWPTLSCPGASARSAAPSRARLGIKPSWYLVATNDRMTPPPAQRGMSERAGSTVIEVPGSHSVYLTQPVAVADPLPNWAIQARLWAEMMAFALDDEIVGGVCCLVSVGGWVPFVAKLLVNPGISGAGVCRRWKSCPFPAGKRRVRRQGRPGERP